MRLCDAAATFVTVVGGSGCKRQFAFVAPLETETGKPRGKFITITQTVGEPNINGRKRVR